MTLTDEKGINPFELNRWFYVSISKVDLTGVFTLEGVFPIINWE